MSNQEQRVKELTLVPKVDGKELAEIDMGEGGQDSIYKDDWVFYKAGYIMIGTNATYSYSIRIARKRVEGDRQ